MGAGSNGIIFDDYDRVTPNPGFKDTVYLQVEYLKKGTKLLRTLIGSHTETIEWYHLQ